MIYPAKHISVSINRDPQDVYRYALDPLNLPEWASGLSGAEIKNEGGRWFADSPMGKIQIKFANENALGVLDHDETLPSGDIVHNPMRVVPNGKGSEVTFVLFQLPAANAADFEKDAATITADLKKLKAILEG